MELERVQALSSDHTKLHELPAHFIRPSHERPENSKAIEGLAVPIISLAQPHEVVVKEISMASKEWGFFLIKDHGVSSSLIKKVMEAGQQLFGLPQEEKEKYANEPFKGQLEGYGTKLVKNTDQKVEWLDYYFHVMAPPSKVNYERWPQNPPSYREATEEYNRELLTLRDKILELLAEGLSLEKNTLKSHLGNDDMEAEMKINMYPPCPCPELALGVEPHTDMSALTILAPNDVPGLQIWKDGKWAAVDYIPDALYIHIGDQLEVLSNGVYKSILHRSLVNKERTRMSWAVFFVPPGDTVIGPIPQLLDGHNPAKYSTKTYADYRYRKLNKLPQ